MDGGLEQEHCLYDAPAPRLCKGGIFSVHSLELTPCDGEGNMVLSGTLARWLTSEPARDAAAQPPLDVVKGAAGGHGWLRKFCMTLLTMVACSKSW